MTDNQVVSIHWFRLDCLRLHDNPALLESLNAHSVKFVFILDPWCFKHSKGPSATVWQFLLECLKDLDNKLHKSPYNSRLLVFRGEPTVVLPKLIRYWKATRLTFQGSQSSYETLKYDKIIVNIAEVNGATVKSPYSHTLFSPETLKAMFGNKPASSFKDFIQNVASLVPSSPVSQPSAVPLSTGVQLPESAEPKVSGEVSIPSLEDLGFSTEERVKLSTWIGGETEALSRLLDYCHEDHEDKNMLNWLLGKNSLSPYFRFGCLSVRYFYAKVQLYKSNPNGGHNFFTRVKKNLLLREYSYHLAMATPNFDQQENNPYCLPIDWENEDNLVKAVVSSQTGIPWISTLR